ncbi:origin recognition complex subunit 1-like isoform X2 [Prorops nasuta]|uniref:origin recognition complex subunit 1-like isoform X2 n=1 Tax=Prorops nasuta TaxID=863751 RepID=UPI0034CD9417
MPNLRSRKVYKSKMWELNNISSSYTDKFLNMLPSKPSTLSSTNCSATSDDYLWESNQFINHYIEDAFVPREPFNELSFNYTSTPLKGSSRQSKYVNIQTYRNNRISTNSLEIKPPISHTKISPSCYNIIKRDNNANDSSTFTPMTKAFNSCFVPSRCETSTTTNVIHISNVTTLESPFKNGNSDVFLKHNSNVIDSEGNLKFYKNECTEEDEFKKDSKEFWQHALSSIPLFQDIEDLNDDDIFKLEASGKGGASHHLQNGLTEKSSKNNSVNPCNDKIESTLDKFSVGAINKDNDKNLLSKLPTFDVPIEEGKDDLRDESISMKSINNDDDAKQDKHNSTFDMPLLDDNNNGNTSSLHSIVNKSVQNLPLESCNSRSCKKIDATSRNNEENEKVKTCNGLKKPRNLPKITRIENVKLNYKILRLDSAPNSRDEAKIATTISVGNEEMLESYDILENACKISFENEELNENDSKHESDIKEISFPVNFIETQNKVIPCVMVPSNYMVCLVSKAEEIVSSEMLFVTSSYEKDLIDDRKGRLTLFIDTDRLQRSIDETPTVAYTGNLYSNFLLADNDSLAITQNTETQQSEPRSEQPTPSCSQSYRDIGLEESTDESSNEFDADADCGVHSLFKNQNRSIKKKCTCPATILDQLFLNLNISCKHFREKPIIRSSKLFLRRKKSKFSNFGKNTNNCEKIKVKNNIIEDSIEAIRVKKVNIRVKDKVNKRPRKRLLKYVTRSRTASNIRMKLAVDSLFERLDSSEPVVKKKRKSKGTYLSRKRRRTNSTSKSSCKEDNEKPKVDHLKPTCIARIHLRRAIKEDALNKALPSEAKPRQYSSPVTRSRLTRTKV